MRFEKMTLALILGLSTKKSVKATRKKYLRRNISMKILGGDATYLES